MPVLKRIAHNKGFNVVIGLMGLIAIPLLLWNLWTAPDVDKVFAFTELATILLLFGTFAGLVEKNTKRR